MPSEDTLMALVNDQVKIIYLHRITVPVLPKKLDRLERQAPRFEIAHERGAENFLIPQRVHAMFDLIRKSTRLGRCEPFTDFKGQWLLIHDRKNDSLRCLSWS